MAITINTNTSAMTAQRNMAAASARSASSLAKLSSGSRVASAKDDAASLAIGTGLRADVSALRSAQINAAQGASVLQIADGAFAQISDILTRMKSLATTAQSDQLSATEVGYLATEYSDLTNEIDRIAATTEFNGTKLLGGVNGLKAQTVGQNVDAAKGFVGFSFDAGKVSTADVFEVEYDTTNDTMTITNNNTASSQTLTVAAAPTAGSTADYVFDDIGVTVKLNSDFATGTAITVDGTNDGYEQFSALTDGTTASAAALDFQVGLGTTANDKITVNIAQGRAQDLMGGTPTALGTDAAAASGEVDTAIGAVNSARATLGAAMSRLEFAGANISVAVENTEAAKSSLLDVDVSKEMTEFTSMQVLIQSSVSMLAQANQQPSMLLKLLG